MTTIETDTNEKLKISDSESKKISKRAREESVPGDGIVLDEVIRHSLIEVPQDLIERPSERGRLIEGHT